MEHSGSDGSIDWRSKGLPADGAAVPRGALKARNWRLLDEDLMLPVAVLRESALRHNADWMRRFVALTGVEIAPHGKTTMSNELFHLQMANGAWGLTAATVGHARIYYSFGHRRILLANQLVGRQSIRWVLDTIRADPDFDFYCLVDSEQGANILEQAISEDPPGRPVQVLLELGYDGGRSGIRTDTAAMVLARRIARSAGLVLRGVEAFEGIVQGAAEDAVQVGGLLSRIQRVAREADAEGLFRGRPILSAGGSAFFDLVAGMLPVAEDAARFRVLLRSGCYLVHDSKFYRGLVERMAVRSPAVASLGEGLRPALSLWAHVHARPEPSRIIVGLGKRDAGQDVALPEPELWHRPGSDSTPRPLAAHRVVRLDDQHAYLDGPADSPLEVGDMVAFGISHPCTTFDKWRTLFVVDDAWTVVDAIETNF
jgi:D-serine dehydratase